MKTKFYWVALLASAAMIAQANAGGHHGGGGSGFGGGFASAPGGGSRGGSGGAFHPAPMQNFGGGRMTYMGRGFSSFGPRSRSFHAHYFDSNAGTAIGTRQFAAARISRGNFTPSAHGSRATTSSRAPRTGTAQVRNGIPTLRADWRSHVFAEHSSNWHRDWDRSRDHWWNGHRCHFFNGAWFIFDTGFDPWWPGWYYPDYYADDYYYDPAYYDSSSYYGEDGGYADQSAESAVVAVQQRLARDGYYRGQIDGVLGPETRAAIAEYQRNYGLRVTGAVTPETLQALGMHRVAVY